MACKRKYAAASAPAPMENIKPDAAAQWLETDPSCLINNLRNAIMSGDSRQRLSRRQLDQVTGDTMAKCVDLEHAFPTHYRMDEYPQAHDNALDDYLFNRTFKARTDLLVAKELIVRCIGLLCPRMHIAKQWSALQITKMLDPSLVRAIASSLWPRHPTTRQMK